MWRAVGGFIMMFAVETSFATSLSQKGDDGTSNTQVNFAITPFKQNLKLELTLQDPDGKQKNAVEYSGESDSVGFFLKYRKFSLSITDSLIMMFLGGRYQSGSTSLSYYDQNWGLSAIFQNYGEGIKRKIERDGADAFEDKFDNLKLSSKMVNSYYGFTDQKNALQNLFDLFPMSKQSFWTPLLGASLQEFRASPKNDVESKMISLSSDKSASFYGVSSSTMQVLAGVGGNKFWTDFYLSGWLMIGTGIRQYKESNGENGSLYRDWHYEESMSSSKAQVRFGWVFDRYAAGIVSESHNNNSGKKNLDITVSNFDNLLFVSRFW